MDIAEGGLTLLHHAAQQGDTAELQQLLQAGADVDARTGLLAGRKTPLHMASAAGHPSVVQQLVEAGADVNAANASDKSSLHLAVKADHAETVQQLVDLGADPNAAAHYFKAPLHLAAAAGNDSVVQILLAAGADPNGANRVMSYYMTPLHLAAEAGHTSVVQQLVAAVADVNAPEAHGQDTPLHVAAAAGQASVVQQLLTAGANVNGSSRKGWTPLHEAAKAGHDTVVDLLVAAGAEVDARESINARQTPLHLAAEYCHWGVAQRLLAAGADVDAVTDDGSLPPPWNWQLFAAGANVDASVWVGRTPLYYAVREVDAELVRILLEAGADVGANMTAPADGQSVLLNNAVHSGNADIVKMVLAALGHGIPDATLTLAARLAAKDRNAYLFKLLSFEADARCSHEALLSMFGGGRETTEFLLATIEANPPLEQEAALEQRAMAELTAATQQLVLGAALMSKQHCSSEKQAEAAADTSVSQAVASAPAVGLPAPDAAVGLPPEEMLDRLQQLLQPEAAVGLLPGAALEVLHAYRTAEAAAVQEAVASAKAEVLHKVEVMLIFSAGAFRTQLPVAAAAANATNVLDEEKAAASVPARRWF